MVSSGLRRRVPLVLLATLVLRASIPDGYMPAAPDSGLLFVLCPTGVPAGFMAALSGSGHHQHHGESDGAAAHLDASHCPIGHMLSSVAAADVHPVADGALQPSEPIALPIYGAYSWRAVVHRSRGPPRLIRTT